MSYEWLIAKRYIWSKRRHPFVGIISVISVLGISVGVAALIVVLAVMNGFDEDLKSRIIGMRAHLVIEKDGVFGDYGGLIGKLADDKEILGVAPYVEAQALVQRGEWGTGVLVRGVDPRQERKVSNFVNYVKEGALTDRADGVVVGSELARRAHLRLGSEIRVLSQNSDKPSRYFVEGVFSSGLYDYDANIIFLNLKSAQALLGLDQAVSGLSLRLKDPDRAAAAKKALQGRLGYPYYVRTWMDMNKTLFGALKLEKISMFLILALIILVACLNIAGCLTILVMDKTRDIGVLKALGARPQGLVKIFAMDGLLLGVTGAAAGLGIGTALCFLLKKYSFVDLPKEIYFVDRLPVRMSLPDTFLILAVAVALSFLSAFYPAWVAGRLDPVRALRYE